ncbi:amidohydrolase family protein [Mycolicibacterium sp. P1-18]|uniref:amidohydrolase family protein n=1 Tax=Mycolicibacterium sp. P1-18 TaxID=2024615 RepID=UPI0011F36500|nr:amidohydrolase family protein [Mycolicibacterium sp. P1-18]
MQTCHCSHFLTGDHSDVWSRRLGRDRALRAFPQRAILAAGGRLALGSDWPIGPFVPREIMASAWLRRPPCQQDSPPIAADQAITPREALHAYTRIPAVIGGREADEGSIAVGKFATLTVFAADPLAVTPDQLASIPIVGTMVRGRFEHLASLAILARCGGRATYGADQLQ